MPPIQQGLKLVGDIQMLDLVDKADQEYLINKNHFELQRKLGDWSPPYDNLKKFDEYDSIYYKIHDNTMRLIEKYARANPDEFVKLK